MNKTMHCNVHLFANRFNTELKHSISRRLDPETIVAMPSCTFEGDKRIFISIILPNISMSNQNNERKSSNPFNNTSMVRPVLVYNDSETS
jgi:hypothetical protein